MAEPKVYDFIIIGAGQGGVPLARALANAGCRTALIEREYVGGTCINVGCTPTKTMVGSARVAYLARRSSDFGIEIDNFSVDMDKIRQRKRDIVDRFRDGSQGRLEHTQNLDLIFGEARFKEPKLLVVILNMGGTMLAAAETIVIDVGGRPAVP